MAQKAPRRKTIPETVTKARKAPPKVKNDTSEEKDKPRAPKPRVKLPPLSEASVLWGTVLVLVSIAREEQSMKQPLRIVKDDQEQYGVSYLVKSGLIKVASSQSQSAEFSLTPTGQKLIQSMETFFRLLIKV